MRSFLKRNLAIVVVATTVLGAAGAVYAAQPGRPTLSAQASGSATASSGQRDDRRHRPGMGGLFRRTVHGDLIVRGKTGFENVTYDRGKLTSVASGSLTIQRPDGPSVTVKLTSTTRYRGVSGPGELEVGKGTVVLSRDGSALVVGQRRDRSGRAPGGTQDQQLFE